MIGDEHGKVTEATKAAERHLKCKPFRSSPFWRKEGFSAELHNKQVCSIQQAEYLACIRNDVHSAARYPC